MFEYNARNGDSPVKKASLSQFAQSKESLSLGILSKMGGIFHLMLNMSLLPIANKYCEGKMKSNAKARLNRA